MQRLSEASISVLRTLSANVLLNHTWTVLIDSRYEWLFVLALMRKQCPFLEVLSKDEFCTLLAEFMHYRYELYNLYNRKVSL